MKYLLSILVLFSGLSFADEHTKKKTYDNYLICDEPYLFYPSLEERWLLGFNTDESEKLGFFADYDDYELKVNVSALSANVTVKGIMFFKNKKEVFFLDRTTLKTKRGKQCKKVSENEFYKEIRNLEKFAEEQRAKRKI